MEVFKKVLIFVPIVRESHWSLCVIVNPGALVDAGTREHKQDDPQSCMIFMDSLRNFHDRDQVARDIRKWLNHELQRKNQEKGQLFVETNFPLFSPEGKGIH